MARSDDSTTFHTTAEWRASGHDAAAGHLTYPAESRENADGLCERLRDELPDVGANEYCMTLEFIRLDYDVETAARKIFEAPELDDFLGTRLFEGR